MLQVQCRQFVASVMAVHCLRDGRRPPSRMAEIRKRVISSQKRKLISFVHHSFSSISRCMRSIVLRKKKAITGVYRHFTCEMRTL